MPNDPTPTPGAMTRASHGFCAYAHVLNSKPEPGFRSAKGIDITLSARLVVGVLSVAQTSYDFQVSLASNNQAGPVGANSTIGFALAPGTLNEFDITVEHANPTTGIFEFDVMVLAAEIGSGNFEQIALMPAIGANPRTYEVK